MTKQASAHEPVQVSTPAARRELRLLCLLVPARDGSTRALPVHTMQPLPPRARLQGLIDRTLASEAGFHLRETHATEPTAEVLERCARHRQTYALRATARTVRTGGVSA